MIARIIIGLLVIGLGYLFVWKTEIPRDMIGTVWSAERYLSGGTTFFYKLMGVVLIIIGAAVVFGLQDNMLDATLGRLFGANRNR